MILYGRDLSPYTRRVAAWCALQGRALERHQITVAGEDFARLREVNPMGRVPTLILDDGTRLVDSWAICDWLDETGSPRLIPASGEARRMAMARIATASATTEKAVAVVYEKNRRPVEFQWPDWQDRLALQVRGGLGELEKMVPGSGLFGGDSPDGADLAVAFVADFVSLTNAWLLEPGYPRLLAHAERVNAIPEIGATKPKP